MQWWDALALACSVVTVIVTLLQWRRSEALQPQRETNVHVQSISHEGMSTESEYREGIIQLRPQGEIQYGARQHEYRFRGAANDEQRL